MEAKLLSVVVMGETLVAKVGFFDGEDKVSTQTYTLDQTESNPLVAIKSKIQTDLGKVETARTKAKALSSDIGKTIDLS